MASDKQLAGARGCGSLASISLLTFLVISALVKAFIHFDMEIILDVLFGSFS